MPLLLGLTASADAPRAPIAEISAASLVGAWTAASSSAAPSSAAHLSLSAALRRDPGLALWAICRCHAAQGGEPRTVGDLATWLLNAPHALVGEDVEQTFVRLTDATLVEQFVGMAECAVNVARRSAELAGTRESEQAYFLGLLHQAPAWLRLAGAATSHDAWLPAWLGQRLSCLSASQPCFVDEVTQAVSQAIASYRSGGIADSDRAFRAAWAAEVPGMTDWLPAWLSSAGRLRLLESKFQETLEAEKLASLAEFAAGAGHEINNPLAVISGRAQMLIRDEPSPERRHSLAAINAQALRVHEMIADMMLFARPPKPAREAVDVGEVVRRVIESLRSRAADADIEFTTNLPPTPLCVDGDATQLTVALKALCENSLDAIGQRGRVEIIARHNDKTFELIVRDTGPGIPPEIRRHIFDPFYSGRSAGRGIGFGLSKCWRIVTHHGGTMEVDSIERNGTAFTIKLPAPQRI